MTNKEAAKKLRQMAAGASPQLMFPGRWRKATIDIYTAAALALENDVCQCKDCEYGYIDPYDGGLRCVNAKSENCTEWVEEHGSCEFCERKRGSGNVQSS